ncbi:DUF3558 domain-containing protein [Amycolatopsis alkalitolerans]|uniref:DUF3558 domain-containing protein n=1 Tax=Amycolatopsis alkalitolerans TaxID=2547244 RepID=A0A5C4M2K9_9PSEU|nr:DUF3558 domain-containing protein [Amycolatopsis alkalitolerans]TNC27238.1 DUF3558 domain-containing protein [Amycolatopsis alkalitolerans]
MSKTRAIQLGAAALAAAGALSACSGGTDVGSIPPATSGAAASSSSAEQLAPRVPSPLPTDALVTNPCTGALSVDQVYKQGLNSPGTPRQNQQTGPSCTWKSAAYDVNSVSITAVTPNKNGLSDIYANKPKDKYFEPTTIAGYPAVYADVQDGRSDGECSLWVGVTDQLAVYVLTQLGAGPNKSNPCPVAERVATAMVQHLQGS